MRPSPESMAELSAEQMANNQITGYGADVTMHVPCPWCGAKDWKLLMPFADVILDNGHASFQKVDTCLRCGRSGRISVGHPDSSTTIGHLEQTDGPPPADWWAQIPDFGVRSSVG